MAKIKGQNLRLFVDGKVVAAATSCQLHVGTEFQEVNTKDDADPEWVQKELSKLNWDVQADALVDINSQETVKCESEGDETYYHNSLITLKSGETIHVFSLISEEVFVLYDDTSVASHGYDGTSYTNENEVDEVVYVGDENLNSTVYYHIISQNTAESFCNTLINESNVTVCLSAATGTTESTQYYSGTVKVTDVSINAAVGQFTTYTVQMTGIGELETE